MRLTVAISLGSFLKARKRTEKSAVIESVLRTIEDSGGTFLKWCKKDQYFTKIVRKKAYEKIGHAFRDMVLARGRGGVHKTNLKFPEGCTSEHTLLEQSEQSNLPKTVEANSSTPKFTKELRDKDAQPSWIAFARDEVGAGAVLPDHSLSSQVFGSRRQAFPRQVSLLEEEEFDRDVFMSNWFADDSPCLAFP
jgi:hypothetical protein